MTFTHDLDMITLHQYHHTHKTMTPGNYNPFNTSHYHQKLILFDPDLNIQASVLATGCSSFQIMLLTSAPRTATIIFAITSYHHEILWTLLEANHS